MGGLSSVHSGQGHSRPVRLLGCASALANAAAAALRDSPSSPPLSVSAVRSTTRTCLLYRLSLLWPGFRDCSCRRCRHCFTQSCVAAIPLTCVRLRRCLRPMLRQCCTL